ncbi:hypothetical protein [Clostridium beijerinckii]|uniref:Uncharacterized protein n=1 Tax=Clostridium beijerinckii TaxID=1520 RepID=A0AAW3W5K0_CLOBE|nr:hypothetical protein [Clostridium beijerinckii]MBC2457160.1 hypothetical protein [Clostridium beijerinckii]MBC2474216.1 hypothetical protein [Clostridium beijerinckii]NOV58685.1 hypothetical protein [Clostridium beijerinckii]NOV71930.1 hypothetical protein [Clostridium beijerinckii]NOW32040.1 hypothetical protein [Clostridium beijerinckii]
MDNKNKPDNRIDLSKLNYKRKHKEEPIHFEPTYLSKLFHKPTDDDPVERQKAREALFRSLKEGKQDPKPPSGSFTK